MYAVGDGVKQDNLRAFEIFRSIAEAYAHELSGTPHARFVANAFVALGSYYLEGIPGTTLKPERVPAARSEIRSRAPWPSWSKAAMMAS